MGGIMASSPELMQVAQRFQVGGPVAPQPPMAGRAPLPPRPSPGPMSLNRALGSPTRPMAPPSTGSPPAVMRELTGDARKGALAGTAPTFGFGSFLSDVPPVPLEEDVGVDDLLDRPTPTTPTPRSPSRPSVERQNELRARRGLPPLSVEQEEEFAKSEREAPLPQEVARAEEIARELADIESRKVDGIAASSQDAADEERLKSEQRQLGERAGETIAAEDVAMAQPLVPRELDQATIDKALAAVRDDPNIPFDPGGAEGDSEPAGGGAEGDPDPGRGDSDTDTPPPKRTKKDLRSRYNEKLELFKEVYGTDDKDEAQDRAMSLAMIGLAIAAGQSPNALTNIAQGALAGLQGMGARREADRDRERGVKTLALETAIGQQEAEAGAEADAAQANIEQANKLQLEEFKAQLGAMYGGSDSRDARNIIDFAQNTYNEALKAASAQTAPDFDPETESPHQYALRQAQAASQGIGRMFPGYGGGAASAPAQPTQDASEVPTVSSQAEYDALPSGAQFMQNGQLRRKP